MSDLICSLASEKCQQEKRKTVNGEDILFAMTSTGFENYAEALKIYLAKYREVSPSTLPLQPCLAIFIHSCLFIYTLLKHLKILTALSSLNHNEERHSRRDRAVATALKRRNQAQPGRARLGSRTHQAQLPTKDKKRVSTTSSVLMHPIPLSN